MNFGFRGRPAVLYCLSIMSVFVSFTLGFSDELYTKNKNAAKLYEKGSYEEALKNFDNLIVEYPTEPSLKMNKGSVQYKMGDLDKAEESYNSATSTKDKKTLADLYYNLGNTQYMKAEKMAAGGDNKSMDAYKSALQNYIKALDLHPSDKDAKWNVQLTQKRIKQVQQQQQQQQNNKDNKDKKKDDKKQSNKDQKQNQDKDNKDQKKDDKKQDNKSQDKNKQDQNKDNQQQSDKDQKQDDKQQKPEPTPQQQKEDMKKDEAKRLIEQFSDDEKDLNKKPLKMGILKEKNQQKDW